MISLINFTSSLFWLDVQNLPQVVVLRQRAEPVLHDGVADNVLKGEVKLVLDDSGLKYGKVILKVNFDYRGQNLGR
jgi:hypothetical protein